MREQQKIYFRGEGDQEVNHGIFQSNLFVINKIFVTVQPNIEPGDVIIVLQGKEHEQFIRDGDSLFIKHTINLTEALCGFAFTIRHLDGRSIVFKTAPGDVIEPGRLIFAVSYCFQLTL